jgi:hypothetical protein
VSMNRTTSQIECDRCGQKTPGLPGLFDWLLAESPIEPDNQIRVETAICPVCQTSPEKAMVDAAQESLHWLNVNAGYGGPATMLGDYLSCVASQLAKRNHRRGDHSRCVPEDGCTTPGTKLVPAI